MRTPKALMGLLLLIVFAAACGPIPAIPTEININIQGPTQDINQIVAATFAAMTVQAAPPPAQSTPTATSGQNTVTNGSIAGKLGQGATHVGVFQVGGDAYYKLDLQQKQTTYQIDNIPPGTYYVIAFVSLGQFAAPFPLGYSNYVTCGMTANCKDHSLIPVTVTAGQVTQNIDPIDNVGNPELNPYMIKYFGFTQTGGTDNIPTNTPPGGQSGSIAGDLTFPASGLPAMAIVAYHVGGPVNDYYYVLTQQGENHYQLDSLPPGQYIVVAYSMAGGGFTGGLPGGYSQAVPCGLQASCTDHSLIVVTVNAGSVTNNVNPQDWYAPDGTFPPYPLP